MADRRWLVNSRSHLVFGIQPATATGPNRPFLQDPLLAKC